MSSHCILDCNKSEVLLECTGSCGKAIHPSCGGISRSRILKCDYHLVFMCPDCRNEESKSLSSSLSDLTENMLGCLDSMNVLGSCMGRLEARLDGVVDHVDSLTASIDQISDQINTKHTDIRVVLKGIASSISQVKTNDGESITVTHLESVVNRAVRKLEDSLARKFDGVRCKIDDLDMKSNMGNRCTVSSHVRYCSSSVQTDVNVKDATTETLDDVVGLDQICNSLKTVETPEISNSQRLEHLEAVKHIRKRAERIGVLPKPNEVIGHVHVTRIDPNMSEESFVDYVEEKFDLYDKPIFCELLKPKGLPRKKVKFLSFKLGVPELYVNGLLNVDNWPPGTRVRVFVEKNPD